MQGSAAAAANRRLIERQAGAQVAAAGECVSFAAQNFSFAETCVAFQVSSNKSGFPARRCAS
jgi:hypothetical protein